MSRFSFLVLLLLALVASSAVAQSSRSPLLMEGKETLYQRVLAKPNARLSAEAGGRASRAVVPFTVYYVYARQSIDGTAWAEVGLDRHGAVAGWLPASRTMDWNQGLTVAFRDPAGNDRSLLFRSREELGALARTQDLDTYGALYEAAEAGTSTPDSPVVAIQPSGYVDILEDFYLVPIRDYADVYLGAERARMLQVSSVPLDPEGLADPSRTWPAPPTAAQSRYRSGIVFVIDATLSMDPYIARTREAVRRVYDSLADADLVGGVSFGLVAFRDDPSAADGLEYRTRIFADLEDGRDAASFFSRVDALSAADISSQDFTEDAYAGVKAAIEGIDWSGHDARYVVLVTDASARAGGHPLSGTGLSAEGIRQLAQDDGIALSVLHLLTDEGVDDHMVAEFQYRELSRFPGIGELYYGVPTGDVTRFGRALDALAGQITEQVRVASGGPSASQDADASASRVDATEDAELAALQERVDRLGYALRMRYLQAQDGDGVPEVFDAWLLDRSFRDPSRPTLDVRVLLTRDQLSDLHEVMDQVLDTAEQGLLSPRNFLNDLQSLAATIARDPERLGASTRAGGASGNLADLGFMREYIEGLPYTAEIMDVTLDDWQDWSAQRQIEFVQRLDEKATYYEALHDNTDLWISLDGGPVDGDSVFPVPLDMLP
ncbi:MAG: vWA domain-containing protein [Pseudomonadota bacterium]